MSSRTVLDYRSSLEPRPTLSRFAPLHEVEVAYHALVGIVIPILCFLLAIHHYPPGPEMQAERWLSYVVLIPNGGCSWPFYPLLGFAIWGMSRMLSDPPQAAENPAVQVALWSGVVLALQYTCIQAVTLGQTFSVPVAVAMGIGAAIIAFCLVAITHWFIQMFRAGDTIAILAAAGLFLCVLTALAAWPLLLIVLLPILIVIPALTMASYAWMGWYADRLRRRFWNNNRPHILAVSWIGAYFIAWDLCALCMVLQHRHPPKGVPSCYIATAGARGHRRFVKSRACKSAGGAIFMANDQLRILKGAELCILALAPQSHRVIRCIYDRFGPPIASMLRHPLLGDLAYILLKPMELASVLGMRVLLPRTYARVCSLYPV